MQGKERKSFRHHSSKNTVFAAATPDEIYQKQYPPTFIHLELRMHDTRLMYHIVAHLQNPRSSEHTYPQAQFKIFKNFPTNYAHKERKKKKKNLLTN